MSHVGLIGQVRIELEQLVRRQHALVDDHAWSTGCRRRRGTPACRLRVAAQPARGSLADDVQLPLEGLFRQAAAGGDKELFNDRHGPPRGRPHVGKIRSDRHRPPAHQPLTLLADDLCNHLLALLPFGIIGRQEHQARAEMARRGQIGLQFALSHLGQEFVRQGCQNSRAVPRVGFAAASAAMIHPPQHVVRVQDQLVAAAAFDIRYQPDATTVVLEGRIVQTVFLGVTQHPSTRPEEQFLVH